MTAPAPLRFERDELRRAQVRAPPVRHAASWPPESVHALDVEGLQGPVVQLWSAWQGDALAGCGALKRLDAERVELKGGNRR